MRQPVTAGAEAGQGSRAAARGRLCASRLCPAAVGFVLLHAGARPALQLLPLPEHGEAAHGPWRAPLPEHGEAAHGPWRAPPPEHGEAAHGPWRAPPPEHRKAAHGPWPAPPPEHRKAAHGPWRAPPPEHRKAAQGPWRAPPPEHRICPGPMGTCPGRGPLPAAAEQPLQVPRD